jgi:4-amino-4-deoxy-L-arabinose transferase-like glycosyltransferase
MLKAPHLRLVFVCTYVLNLLLLGYAAANHQLFGDEAFYWLEGRHLDWSYAELPDWTQWLTALTDHLLPNGIFFLRLTSLIAGATVPFLGMAIIRSLGGDRQAQYMAGLLLLALPLMGLASILAIPDVWVMFFALLALWCLSEAIKSGDKRWYLYLGLALALGINVHIRFWFIVMLAGLLTLWLYRDDSKVVRLLLGISLPCVVIGLLPVLLFNLQHDFPLLSFQLQDRHPWSFQPQHAWFFITDVLVATPLIFVLCLLTVWRLKTTGNKRLHLVLLLAVLHWLFYALVGFFTDDLRFSLHWTLFSHALLLLLASITLHASKWVAAAITTGLLCSWGLQWLLLQWSQPGAVNQSFQDRFTANSRGWEALAAKTRDITAREQPDQLITDHFMTLSTLLYHNRGTSTPMTVLSHPLNIKHGRQTQLQIMGYLPESQSPADKTLVIIEQTALDLEQQITYYLQTCEQLGGLELIDQLDTDQGVKIHHFFLINEGRCDLPPISYTDIRDDQLNGWVVVDTTTDLQVGLMTDNQQVSGSLTTTTLGSNPLFSDLDANRYALLQFSFAWPSTSGSRGQLTFSSSAYNGHGPAIYRD